MTSMTRFKDYIAQRWNTLDDSWRFAITVFIIARLFYALWSWVIITIQPIAIQNFELSGEPIVSIFRLKNSEVYVYHREVNGEVLIFQPLGTENIIDQQTGTIWNISNGTAIKGQYKRSNLSSAKTKTSDIFPYFGVKPFPGTLLALWQRFDTNWYVSIAEHGYGSIPGDDHFPPLYPFLIRIVQPILRNTFLAGLLISHIAIFITLKLLYDVFSQWGEKRITKRALIFFAIYPTFFFFFSAYSEPVFLLITLLAFQAMHVRRWLWAGFWIFCAILTRLQGVALLLPMLYLMWKDRSILRMPSYWIGMFVAGDGGLFYLYLRSIQVTSGAVPFVEADWHARLVPPWETYWYAVRTILTGNSTFIDVLNWAVMTLVLVLLLWGWKRIPAEYNLYTMFSIFIILIRIVETQPLISMSRYSLMLFPSFYTLSLAGENSWFRRAIIYISILLNLYLSGQFFIWGWVA